MPHDSASLLWSFALLAIPLTFRYFILLSTRAKSPLDHIPGPPSQSCIMGNLGQLFNKKGLRYHHDLVVRFGGVVKVHGFFRDEQLYITDPGALRHIFITDQDAFEETPVFTETPCFMRSRMFIRKQAEIIGPTEPIDMAEWSSRVALEAVGRTVLGYSLDPLDSPHNNPYTSAVKELIPTLFSLSILRQFAPFLAHIGSPSFRRLLVDLTPVATIQKVKHMSDIMYSTARGILREKRSSKPASLATTNGSAAEVLEEQDIISSLLRANARASESDKLSDEELIGQMTVLIFGAQDTTSSALSRMLYQLSLNPDIQARVREEILSIQSSYSRQLSHDEIMQLPWLEAVMRETLRLYPPVPFVRRVATQDITVTLSKPIDQIGTSRLPLTSVMIPTGTTLFIGIAAANRLESIWGSDANIWKPERWIHGSKSSNIRLPGIYAGTMTFLAGHRACVGYNFAQLEMKIFISSLLANFQFSVTNSEIVWNLSQIISPSVLGASEEDETLRETQGLPLMVTPINIVH